jgi:hypothetical protein
VTHLSERPATPNLLAQLRSWASWMGQVDVPARALSTLVLKITGLRCGLVLPRSPVANAGRSTSGGGSFVFAIEAAISTIVPA